MNLNGMHIFVTGGAQGIGAAIVKDAAERGGRVSFGDIQDKLGKDYADSLRESGLDVTFVHCDVGNLESVAQAHQEVVAQFGMVNGLVNNAGVSSNADPVEMTSEEWDYFSQLI